MNEGQVYQIALKAAEEALRRSGLIRPQDDKTLLTVLDAARALKMSKEYIYCAINAGELRAVDMRGHGAKKATWRIRPEDLETFKNQAK